MCTFNISIDDKVVNTARKSFADDNALTAWMQQQITVLLSSYVPAPETNPSRKPHKHDSLMGVISNVSDQDIKLFRGVEKVKASVVTNNDITQTAGFAEAMDDKKHGRIYHAESVDDMFNQILGAE